MERGEVEPSFKGSIIKEVNKEVTLSDFVYWVSAQIAILKSVL